MILGDSPAGDGVTRRAREAPRQGADGLHRPAVRHQVRLELAGVRAEPDVSDGKLEDAAREAEQIKAFRDTWELGIHSYLSYLRDRLLVARDLLTESGSCFVQIGDENVHLVRSLMDEVFGRENFCQSDRVRRRHAARIGGRTLPRRQRLHRLVREGPRAR